MITAAGYGNFETVKRFLPSANQRAREHSLWFAANNLHDDVVQLLLDDGVDPNSTYCGGCPLSAAIHWFNDDLINVQREKMMNIVTALLDAGANLFINENLLATAASHGLKEIVEFLLTVGLDASSGLNAAVNWGRIDIVHVLLDAGACIDDETVQDALNRKTLELQIGRHNRNAKIYDLLVKTREKRLRWMKRAK